MIGNGSTIETAGAAASAHDTAPRARALQPWFRQHALTILCALAALVPFVLPSLAPALEFDRDQPWQLWRWLTCHFTHFDGEHLFWSLAVLVALMAWLEPLGRRRLLACLATTAIAIPAALLLFAPELPTYRGLSGLDSALFVALMITWAREAWAEKRSGMIWLCALAGVGFLAKLAYELFAGAGVFAGSEAYVPVPLAHAVGAGVGILFAVRGELANNPRP